MCADECQTSMSVDRNINHEDEIFCIQESNTSPQETTLRSRMDNTSQTVNVTSEEANLRQNDHFEQAKSKALPSNKKSYKDALMTHPNKNNAQDKRI